MSNVDSPKSNVKCQMSIRLNFCQSVPPELLRSFFKLKLEEMTLHIKGLAPKIHIINNLQQKHKKTNKHKKKERQTQLNAPILVIVKGWGLVTSLKRGVNVTCGLVVLFLLDA